MYFYDIKFYSAWKFEWTVARVAADTGNQAIAKLTNMLGDEMSADPTKAPYVVSVAERYPKSGETEVATCLLVNF